MFNSNARHLPTLSSYQDAARRYERTPPIRGRPGRVPLLDNRRYHDTYRIEKDSYRDAYMAVLHATPIVTYHADGRIELDLSYPSRMTQESVNALLPGTLYLGSDCRSISFGYRHALHEDITAQVARERAQGHVRDPDATLRFVPAGSVTLRPGGHVDGLEHGYTMRLTKDKKRLAEHRALVKPFLQYASTMLSLMTWEAACSTLTKETAGPLDTYDIATPERWSRAVAKLIIGHITDIAHVRSTLYDLFHMYEPHQLPFGTLPTRWLTKGQI